MGVFRRNPQVTFDGPVESKKAARTDVAKRLTDQLLEKRQASGRLGDLIRAEKGLSEEDLNQILTMQSGTGRRMGVLLIEQGMATEADLAHAIGTQLGLAVIDLTREAPEQAAVNLLAETVARSLNVLPLRVEGNQLVIAVEDPLQEGLIEELTKYVEHDVVLSVAGASAIRSSLNRAYRSGNRVTELAQEYAAAAGPGVEDDDSVDVSTAPVVRIVDEIITQSVRDRASDIHIEPRDTQVVVRSRVDGAMKEDIRLPKDISTALVSRIKLLSGMDIIEKRKPQDGQMKFKVDGNDVDLRVSSTPMYWGEKLVLRVLDKGSARRSLHDLGMPGDTHVRFKNAVDQPSGMVVVAGPTGSGKTTSLYAALNEIASDTINISTIEDPVEYVVPEINQMQIDEKAGLTFAEGLRSLLRQDPDVILVGEIRDVETADIAIKAAMTGHMVLSSVHANDAASALHRFIDMDIEAAALTASITAIVSQRLVRRTCSDCRQEYTPDAVEVEQYARLGGKPKTRWERGVGCNVCANTGFSGRVGVFEVLIMDDELRMLVTRKASRSEIHSLAIERGMRALASEALGLVEENITTLAEVAKSVRLG